MGTKLVTHPDEEMGHPAVKRHEEALHDIKGTLAELIKQNEAFEKDRIQREMATKVELEEREKRRDAERRAFVQEQNDKRDEKLINAIRNQLPSGPLLPNTPRQSPP